MEESTYKFSESAEQGTLALTNHLHRLKVRLVLCISIVLPEKTQLMLSTVLKMFLNVQSRWEFRP